MRLDLASGKYGPVGERGCVRRSAALRLDLASGKIGSDLANGKI
jgi:hypothetical protein